MPHPLASLPCTHSAPSLPLALHFTWTTLLAQQAQVAALVDNDQRQHQLYTNQQDEMAELAARNDALLARLAALEAAQAVAPPIHPPAQPPTSMVSHESPPTCT